VELKLLGFMCCVRMKLVGSGGGGNVRLCKYGDFGEEKEKGGKRVVLVLGCVVLC
jgi:hypothetical protein